MVHRRHGVCGRRLLLPPGLLSPTQLPVGSPTLYVALVVDGTVLFTGLPLLIGILKQASIILARCQSARNLCHERCLNQMRRKAVDEELFAVRPVTG